MPSPVDSITTTQNRVIFSRHFTTAWGLLAVLKEISQSFDLRMMTVEVFNQPIMGYGTVSVVEKHLTDDSVVRDIEIRG